MRDEVLRQAERRWLEGGTLSDEITWLETRVRVGDLTPGRLWIAAFLGHGASRQALGLVRGDPEIIGVDLTPLQPLVSPSEFDLVRIEGAAIAVRGTLLSWRDVAQRDSHSHRALLGVRRWRACPCTSCAAPLAALARACHETQAISAAELCRAVLTSDPAERSGLLESVVTRETMQEVHFGYRLSRWERDTDARELRMTWREELTPWALAKRPWPESL